MKRIFFLAAFISAFITLAVAQTHMFVWKNGMSTDYAIINVDSITFGNKSDASDTASKGIGLFSIGENKYVTFSKGNLQYHPKNAEWRFAFNQYDCIGDANKNISIDYDGWIDLFGWGTGEEPINYSVEYSDYPFFVDWGTNVIGTDAAYTWRTLSNSEWIYLFNSRPNARSLYGIAQVAGVNGMIILPDNWTDSIGINFKSGLNNNGSGSGYYAVYQSFTAEQWSIMEDAGAVFLPASGFRYGTEIYDFTLFGYYWHKTEYVSESAFYMYFDSGYFGTDLPILRYYGYSVRLAKDVFIDDTPNDPDEPSTPEDPDVPSEDGHESVDLGLSVKWATCNVGANNPEEYGDYFAWGETEPKDNYSWNTYKWCNGDYNNLIKYNTSSDYGTVDNKTQLYLSDDVAHVNWGGNWRMPTDAEWTELRNKCTWICTTLNGINGYKVTSKSNGNSIFLPASGLHNGNSLEESGNYGDYWSSLLDSFTPSSAFVLCADPINVGKCPASRYVGLSVRPVLSDSIVQESIATITTSVIMQITSNSAIAGGNVTADGGTIVTERGVVYATTQNPTTSNTKITAGKGSGSFTCDLTDLQPNTTYYVRAYAINSVGTAYGEEVGFTTREQSSTPNNGTENGHAYVDLGLSVKWASYNIGATKPEEYGDYFAWGETEPKDVYTWSSYKWCKGSETTLTKYNNNTSYGNIDNKTQLELSDDVAHVNWGGSWRMPTDAEWTELRNNCILTWNTHNGVNGYKVTSKSNGNSIFLPAAGCRNGSSLNNAGNRGDYWSSSLFAGSPVSSRGVYFISSGIMSGYGNGRKCGLSVRPVFSDSIVQESIATITTSVIMQITTNSAIAGGNVTSDGNAEVSERGVVYATIQNPTTKNNKVASGSGIGEFTCDLTGLQEGTTYYVRAYAMNSKGVAYGEEVSFTTEESSSTPSDGTENGYEYVDLGLSVKWATCNVGASKPEEYGDYFAWGETTTKTPYDLISYKYWDGLYNILTKYNTNNSMGIVDNKNTLEMSDDVAHAKWGKDWRMPTYAEFTELNNECTWTWSTQNGVNGYKVTSKSNGNSIFLPVVGYRCDSLLHNAIDYGYYWSSSLDTDRPHYAYCMYFDSGSVSSMFGSFRYYGLSVRPVLIETTLPTLVTSAVTQITETTAITGGNVTNEGEAKVTERGVVYGTNQNPTIADAKNVSGSGKGEFICSLTDLQPNATYYVRAYATNAKGTSYGMEVSFTTKQELSAMPEYIDLGLSVKWSAFNVGASKAEDYGDHFAWGETTTKSTYDWSSYKYCNGSKNTLTKYNTSNSYGIVDNKTQLELSDDAARVNWGGNWRIPTDAEWTELREQCTWSWTTHNGVNGYKVTSKSNGNSIFLPAAGYPSNGSLTSVGDYGCYWSSSLNTNNPYTSMQVHFLSSFVYRSSGHRDSGHSIRPVHPQHQPRVLHLSHPSNQWICGVFFYIAIPHARIAAYIQVLLRHGLGISSENGRLNESLRSSKKLLFSLLYPAFPQSYSLPLRYHSDIVQYFPYSLAG